MAQRGAYPADRTAALSGVPMSTVHWWARNDVLVPSISAHKVKLWSYPDLMGLRIIYWLRQTKEVPDGKAVPRTRMPAVRQALAQLAELDLGLWSEDTGPTVRVDRGGNIVVSSQPHAEVVHRQRALDAGDEDLLSVTDPFWAREGSRGPDLKRPRPRLRIVPGKLGGSPHVAHTRLESQALGALAISGLSDAKIYEALPTGRTRRDRRCAGPRASAAREPASGGRCLTKPGERVPRLGRHGDSPAFQIRSCSVLAAASKPTPSWCESIGSDSGSACDLDDWELLVALHQHSVRIGTGCSSRPRAACALNSGSSEPLRTLIQVRKLTPLLATVFRRRSCQSLGPSGLRDLRRYLLERLAPTEAQVLDSQCGEPPGPRRAMAVSAQAVCRSQTGRRPRTSRHEFSG